MSKNKEHIKFIEMYLKKYIGQLNDDITKELILNDLEALNNGYQVDTNNTK